MSKISIEKKVGKSKFTFEIEISKIKEGLAAAALFAGTPDKCTVCESEDVTLESNRTQEGYLYVKVHCLNPECGATATLGEYKDGKGGFWKKFEKYERKEKTESEESTSKAENQETESEEESDGIPF